MLPKMMDVFFPIKKTINNIKWWMLVVFSNNKKSINQCWSYWGTHCIAFPAHRAAKVNKAVLGQHCWANRNKSRNNQAKPSKSCWSESFTTIRIGKQCNSGGDQPPCDNIFFKLFWTTCLCGNKLESACELNDILFLRSWQNYHGQQIESSGIVQIKDDFCGTNFT